jgi:hypothetical protein
MKLINRLAMVTVAMFVTATPTLGAVYNILLSPPADRALNLGGPGFIYPGDHAPGLSPLNEGAVVNSTGSGDILGGIRYDDVTNLLTFDVAYGSAFGFSDLVSNWNGGVHIHGNGNNTALFPATNANAGVIYDLASSHTSSGPRSGRITGTRTLTETHELWLFRNQLYLNVHSQQFGPGEIRGQLVIIPEPTAVFLALVGMVGLFAGRRRR